MTTTSPPPLNITSTPYPAETVATSSLSSTPPSLSSAPPSRSESASASSTPPSRAESSGSAAPYRILVVDDNPSIHDDFERIFASERPGDEGLDRLAAAVFGLPAPAPQTSYVLDHVDQGETAIRWVIDSRERGEPYALLFMDVRMPGGLDGLEAAQRVLESDPDVHVVLCTAYPERSWKKRVQGLPGRDRLLVLKKPFDILEIQQLACALCEKWLYTRRDRARMNELETSVTEQQGQLALVESRLRKAERLESLGRMAAGLCHEINNPLTYIVNSTELAGFVVEDLAGKIPPSEQHELEQLIAAISTGATRITRLVRNIQLFARRNKTAPAEVVELAQCIETAVAMIQPHRHPDVAIEVHAASAPKVMGRRLELEQVLINLMQNAIHAMEGQRDPRPRITVAVRTDKTEVTIDVADTGPGIDETLLGQIFDPFFTTKPVNKGTGLGLSICHSLIEGMSGTIDVRNRSALDETRRGAVFTIRLPRAPASKAPATPAT